MELVFPLAPSLIRSPVSSPDQEAEWIERARNGDRGAFDSLATHHRGRILNLAFQILRDAESAEDAAQEAFVHAFSKLHSFRGAASFGTWLYRISLNVCLEKRRVLKPETSDENEALVAPQQQSDLKLTLEWVLDQLPEPLRIVLILREWHGLSYEEMAHICAVPVGTIRSRLHEGRARFRTIWLEIEGPIP